MEELIFGYFPNLSERQRERIKMLFPLYKEWNEKINVVSRKDIDKLYLHHVLHSLAIAKYYSFPAGTKIMDVGTGGGFPGIPLAILFEECEFVLVDSIGKKTKVAQAVADALGLENVRVVNGRAEQVNETFDFIVSRAVTELKGFLPWVKGKYTQGILYLKGGDITWNQDPLKRGALLQEIDMAAKTNRISRENIMIADIKNYFTEDFFEEKRIIHIFKNPNEK
ncbi:MAG: 16S rRNA (guanine(527)-N(7))-methyltransferase RsmG [Bacteroidales bacterium]|nr:16S rRNA (guanine(527)-N(7))-methyltransferase RsmG [Bacteroidales bacterium]